MIKPTLIIYFFFFLACWGVYCNSRLNWFGLFIVAIFPLNLIGFYEILFISISYWLIENLEKKTHLMDCTGNGLKKRRKLELHFVVYLHFSFQIDPWHKQVKEQISTFFPPVPCRLHKWKTSASKKQCHYSINKISPLICEFLVGAR